MVESRRLHTLYRTKGSLNPTFIIIYIFTTDQHTDTREWFIHKLLAIYAVFGYGFMPLTFNGCWLVVLVDLLPVL